MTLGFVGTGTIASAIIEGLNASANDLSIIVSPRNAEIARDLGARFANVKVAATNQGVLDASDVIVLAVRPQIADSVIRELRFRPDHHVISLMAVVSFSYLKNALAPAATVTRAVPIPSVARRQGPTAFFPPNPMVKALFDSLGTAIELDTENEFSAFSTATAMMASYFQFSHTIASWLSDNGVDPKKANAYVGQMMLGLAGNWVATPDRDFALLADEHQTRGGINKQVVDFIAERNVFISIAEALDEVKARLLKAKV